MLSLSKNMLKNFLTPARPANLQVLHLEGASPGMLHHAASIAELLLY